MAVLFIQAEEGGPFWQVWPEQDTIPPGAIREARSYLFELRDSDGAQDAELMIDDVPVEALRSRQPHVARWRWTPGFHAGIVEIILKLPAASPRRFEIVTDPDIHKLTRSDFDTMVRELLEDTFALFSLSTFRKGIARQTDGRPPALARLEFLRSRANEITEVVAAIGRSPRHFLRAEEVTVPAHKASRATGPEIIKSFRSGQIRSEISSPSRLPAVLCGRLPANIKLRKRRNSVDIPEHRQIKACLRSWAAWLMNVAEILGRTAATDDIETMTTATTWAVRTQHIARKINNAAESPFLKNVGEGPATLRMSSLFQRDPVYQRFYRLWQDMNLGLAALFGDFLQMPLARTYELYELWCFLRLVRAASDEYGPAGLDVSNLFIKDTTGGVTIAAGAVMVPVGGGNILCFQKKYREYWIEPSGQGSFSRAMVPDIVFTCPGSAITGAQLIVLDAKYRINEGLNDAINSIHTYRDALVQEAESNRIEGIVTAAYLLTPHVPELGCDFRSTQLPGRLFHPLYREKFRFGAVTLRPGMSAMDLRICLKTIVADAVAQGHSG